LSPPERRTRGLCERKNGLFTFWEFVPELSATTWWSARSRGSEKALIEWIVTHKKSTLLN